MELDESPPAGAARARITRRRRVWTVGLAVAVVAGVGVALYVHAALAPDPEQIDRIQKDLDYVAGAAEGHTLYAPEPWVDDPASYPTFATTVPEGGVTSSGYLDGKWLIVDQFDADALTRADKDVSETPRTLCDLTRPAGRLSSFTAASGDRVKVRTVCLDVPDHPARVRLVVYLADGDAMVDLATSLPEHGRVLDAGHYEDDPTAVADLVASPTSWAGEVLDSLTEIEPGRYDAEDVYAAEKDAGRYD